MTLVELLVGLAVASLVAIIVMTGLSAMGATHRRGLAARRSDDEAWLALAAIAADKECRDTTTCHKRWRVDDGLAYCREHCQPYTNGVASLDVLTDGGSPETLTIRLVLHDGRLYERAVVRR
ncbi:hypothetical protein [Luteibacter sp.]|uniref:hypothetical protein n=1 Tax=Luteibacter sp. TaxID=1886636 RepID=UPI0025C4D06E|nr:hypothetical protein [Luteibacter sp.]